MRLHGNAQMIVLINNSFHRLLKTRTILHNLSELSVKLPYKLNERIRRMSRIMSRIRRPVL